MLNKKVSAMGLLEVWLTFAMAVLAVGAAVFGGAQGRNMAIVAVMIGVALALGFIKRRDEDKKHR